MQGRRRLARGSAAAAASTFIALMSHLIGGGAMPGPLGLLVPLLVATAAGVLLAGVRLPWLRLGASVVVGQLGFHTLFVLGAGGSSTAVEHAHHGAMFVPEGVTAATGVGPMGLAHAVAAVMTMLALRHGEYLLGRIGALLRRAVARMALEPLPVLVRAEVPPSPTARVVVRDLSVVCGPVVWRGPPRVVGPVLR